jgi:ABC-type lipoprotein export system ATPase subunit
VENVEIPLVYSGGRVDRVKALTMLQRVGLGERAHHFATELSGGEQQRVAIARALMNDPPLLLADEPTGNLDSVAGESIMRLLSDLHRNGRTIVLVTHDEQVASYASRELILADGQLVSDVPRAQRSLAGAAQ